MANDPAAAATRTHAAADRAAVIGMVVALVIVAVAVAVPLLTGWDVASRAQRSADDRALPPLHGVWVPHVGVASLAAVAIAGVAWLRAPRLALSLSWRGLLAASWAGGLAWLLALALVDGPTGLSRQLGNPYEYLRAARAVQDVPGLLAGYLARVPYGADEAWVTHVAGHPPAMLLFFVLLVRLGLGADLVAGIIVTLVAALLPAAVLVTLRALGAEGHARRAAPFLVFTPAAVFLAVSADAVIATAGAWGIASLALAATARRRAPGIGWALAAGVLLGTTVMMSYGMPLLGVLAVAVLAVARTWRPLPLTAAAAAAVVLAFAAAGFALWDAYPVVTERYWDGIAARRPGEYWVWANLAALAISAGPAVGAGLGAVAATARRIPLAVTVVAAAGAAMVLLADLSGMSKGEVERIWLPFVPWLTVGLAALSDRWARIALGVQLVWALLVQHLLYTVW